MFREQRKQRAYRKLQQCSTPPIDQRVIDRAEELYEQVELKVDLMQRETDRATKNLRDLTYRLKFAIMQHDVPATVSYTRMLEAELRSDYSYKGSRKNRH